MDNRFKRIRERGLQGSKGNGRNKSKDQERRMGKAWTRK